MIPVMSRTAAFLASMSIVAAPAAVAGASRWVAGHAARSVNIDDTGHLHLVRSSGSRLFEEGAASGALPGKMKANLEVGATFSGTFTIAARGGTISGHGSAVPHGSGRYESFSGTATITGGTGRYAHIHGRAGIYGTFDRRAYGFVFQTTGRLSY